MMELLVYACFVYAYFLLVLHFLGGWIKHVFDDNKLLYAVLAVVLICGQAVLLERLTSGLLWVLESMQGVVLVLRRLTRPHETVTRPAEAPGLLVYRFGGPLFFFNAAHFADRVQALIDSAEPPVTVFLIDAEAVVDMDLKAGETLEALHERLKKQDVVLGICEAKGHFLQVLRNTSLTEHTTIKLYASVAEAIDEINKENPSDGIVPV